LKLPSLQSASRRSNPESLEDWIASLGAKLAGASFVA
jgi:hypothetical protein